MAREVYSQWYMYHIWVPEHHAQALSFVLQMNDIEFEQTPDRDRIGNILFRLLPPFEPRCVVDKEMLRRLHKNPASSTEIAKLIFKTVP